MAKAGEAAKGWVGDAVHAGDQFRAGFDARMAALLGGGAAAPEPKLRGTLSPPQTGSGPQPPRSRYLVDLSRPGSIPSMTTCADADCSHSRVDQWPAAGLGRSISYPELRAGIADLLAGRPVDRGPHITFDNDRRGNLSPDQPLTTPTARMIAAGVLQSGVRSVNINSSTGGKHGDRSLHYRHQAMDMNRVNGQRVSGTNPGIELQDAFLAQPNIAEDYGPAYLLNDKGRGQAPVRTGQRLSGTGIICTLGATDSAHAKSGHCLGGASRRRAPGVGCRLLRRLRIPVE